MAIRIRMELGRAFPRSMKRSDSVDGMMLNRVLACLQIEEDRSNEHKMPAQIWGRLYCADDGTAVD